MTIAANRKLTYLAVFISSRCSTGMCHNHFALLGALYLIHGRNR